MLPPGAVVPYYFLVWYNSVPPVARIIIAVVPYYFLVWYNNRHLNKLYNRAVVPYYFLVWYNRTATTPHNLMVMRGFSFKKTHIFTIFSKNFYLLKNINQLCRFACIVKDSFSQQNMNRFVLLFCNS